jgi:Kelch motif/Bacterial Ig-like domain (group 2)/Galactose oxidase, central domain
VSFSKQIRAVGILMVGMAGGMNAGALTMYPGVVDFGSQFIGNITYSAAFVQNASHKPINISNIQIDGDFTIQTTTCGSVVPADYSCNFTLIFTPAAGGTRTGTLSLNDNAGDGTLKVKLTGVGVPVQLVSLTVSPAVASVPAGFHAGFQAWGTYNNGAVQYLTPTVIWSSSAQSVASVDAIGMASALSPGITSIMASFQGVSGSATFTVTPNAFLQTGSMVQGRGLHTSTTLPGGRVLVAGGFAFGNPQPGVEVYDPASGAFSQTGAMSSYRYAHTATLLNNGKVLLTGGVAPYSILSSAELYDPATGGFALTGSMSGTRYYHTATLLKDGRVLIAGGMDSLNNFLKSAEIYDPATGAFTPAGDMQSPRVDFTATALSNGRVLVAGGRCFCGPYQLTAAAEVFDPATATFSPTSAMSQARNAHSAVLLSTGKVLLAAGYGSAGEILTSAELYDPASGQFTSTGSLTAAHYRPTMTLLANSQVLVAGGAAGSIVTGETYDPVKGAFTSVAGGMPTGFGGEAASLLADGSVLITGGNNSNGDPCAAAYLYVGSK